MSITDVIIPSDIETWLDPDKREFARKLMSETTLDNGQIAEKVFLSRRTVAQVRNHALGKVPNPHQTKTSTSLVAEPPGQDVDDEEEATPKDAPDFDTSNPPSGPVRGTPSLPVNTVVFDPDREKAALAKVHQTSATLDSDARLANMEKQIAAMSRILTSKPAIQTQLPTTSNPVYATPQQPQTQPIYVVSPQTGLQPTMSTETTFESYREPVYIDNYRRALFEQWKATRNDEIRRNGGTPYSKGLDGFLLECFDEFFETRGIDLQYTEIRPSIRPSANVRRMG